jgi:hypothetical protein
LVVIVVLLGLGVVATAYGGSSSSSFRSSLNGDKEVGDGDPNGRGTFTARFSGGRLCYTLRFTGLDDPIAAHVHRGRSTQNGAVVVDLRPRFTDAGARSRCVSVAATLRRSIRNGPSRFYVNVHTERYPDGAIRGQLRRR